MEQFSFTEHVHRYAVWTAARAVQRNFTTTKNIEAAITSANLRSYAEDTLEYSADGYDKAHCDWAEAIISKFRNNNVKCSYGRAAKIIAIYLKTSVIICNKGECAKSQVIHPPIDRKLLTRLSEEQGLEKLAQINWTQLASVDYWNLVALLRRHFGFFNWRIEKHWKA